MALRYNNPGNIRSFYSGGQWSKPFTGETLPPLFTPGQTAGYRKFETLPYGYRALFIVLKQNYLNKGFNTIATIFPRYAPAGDGNNPGAYIAGVEKMTGIKRDTVLNTYSDLIPVVKAITKIETGTTADNNAVIEGYKLLNGGVAPKPQAPAAPEPNAPDEKKKNKLIVPVLIGTAATLIIYAIWQNKQTSTTY